MSHSAAFAAFFDSSAFHVPCVRDLLLRLAATNLFRVRWSAQVLNDWCDECMRLNPELDFRLLEEACRFINEDARDALVSGHEVFFPILETLCPASRHVVAAAIHSRSDVIVTTGEHDYPCELLKRHALHTETPDEFIVHLLDLDRSVAELAVKDARLALRSRPRGVGEYLSMLERAGLTQTVSILHRRQ